MAEISNEALEKLGVSGGAAKFGEGIKNLSAAEKATMAAAILGAGAAGTAGGYRLGSGHWLPGGDLYMIDKTGDHITKLSKDAKKQDANKYALDAANVEKVLGILGKKVDFNTIKDADKPYDTANLS